jgi:hypothetical protein
MLLPAVPLAQMRVDRALGSSRSQEEVLYLWSGDHVKRLCLGFEGVMADVYWLRTVQYFGGQRAFSLSEDFSLLEPLIDITVSLDPRFEIAYRYGAIFLSEPRPLGAGRPEAGVALLRRATEALPGSWRLRQELGFFTYMFLADHEAAAEVLLEAAEIPGSPYWLKTMAGSILGKGGKRQIARRIWQELYDRAEAGVMKEIAHLNLQRLDAKDLAEALEQQVALFLGNTGRLPGSLTELRTAGLLAFVPQDPTGVELSYDPETGRVAVSRDSTLWVLE